MKRKKNFKFLKKIIFSEDKKIKYILKKISSTIEYTDGISFAILVDKKNKCVGVVTDGDIRRSLTKDCTTNTPIKYAMKKNFTFVVSSDSSHKIIRAFDKNINLIPLLSKDKEPIDLFIKSSFFASSYDSNENIVRARVPMRVSFSGGGTDLSEYINKDHSSVICSTLNKYCTASIIPRNDKKISILSKDLEKKYSAKDLSSIKFDNNLDLLKSAVLAMQPDFGFDLETFSECEPGTGLGGSSAIVVAVISVFNYFRTTNSLNNYQVSDLAYKIERLDQKIQGGWQDQYATTFGGFNLIQFKKNEIFVEPLRIQKNTLLELEYNLMLFKLNLTRKSGKIQKDLKKNFKMGKISKSLIYKVQKITNQIKICLLNGSVKEFGDLLDLSWQLKKKINKKSTNQYVDKCYKVARNNGALGGKLLGAGESGYLLIYSSPVYQKNIKDKLQALGAKFENFKFNEKGIEVWKTSK